jgi:hypothetical protein
MELGWRIDLENVPTDRPYLVLLDGEHVSSKIHVAQKLKIANGCLTIVASYFSTDLPNIVAWATLDHLLPGHSPLNSME